MVLSVMKKSILQFLGDFSKDIKIALLVQELQQFTAIMLNGRIFSIGQSCEATRWMVCYQCYAMQCNAMQ